MSDRLSLHFRKSEFACHCGTCLCDGSAIDSELIAVLELVRSHFSAIAEGGRALVHINSAHRCPDHNRAVGGATSSKHLAAKAADIAVWWETAGTWEQVRPGHVADYLDGIFLNRFGIGRYEDFTHIDVREGRAARWNG